MQATEQEQTKYAPTYRKEKIKLRPWQVEWANRAIRILRHHHGYIDTSAPGDGKSYILLSVALRLKLRILVVCPLIVVDIWRQLAEKYGVLVYDIITYQSLRSKSGGQPRHGLLSRHQDNTFTTTEKFREVVNEGILLVLDEVQYTKNNCNSQHRSCHALVKDIYTTTGKSKYALLSGTPLDKIEHVVSLLRLIGYIKRPRLYIRNRAGQVKLLGLQDLIDECCKIDSETTLRLLGGVEDKFDAKQLCYMLYIHVVKKKISGGMVADKGNRVVRFDIKNGFYRISQSRQVRLHDALEQLTRCVDGSSRESIGEITKALVKIENAKTLDFARVARKILTDCKTNKVIISLNYNSTIAELTKLLEEFDPLLLTGETKNRTEVVVQFNNTNRLLLMNTAIAVGINLHDTTGDRKRYMLVSPTYRLLEVIQAAARIYRDGTKSEATVRLFYALGSEEPHILEAMRKKSLILGELWKKQ